MPAGTTLAAEQAAPTVLVLGVHVELEVLQQMLAQLQVSCLGCKVESSPASLLLLDLVQLAVCNGGRPEEIDVSRLRRAQYAGDTLRLSRK